jgi:N-acetylmuramoyl-L-alanine amidase
MSKVFLGVGHGGKDSGAVGNGFKEKDLNLDIALYCQAELVRYGVTVGMSRTTDENDDLKEEIRECNAFKPDLAVDIHNNAGGGDGVEAFYSYTGDGKELAENILAEVVKLGQNSRGAKTKKNSKGNDYYGFIRQVNTTSVIVECAFIDNAEDIKIIDTDSKRKAMGIAIAKGILKTLGIIGEPAKVTENLVLTWQKAAIADGFKFPKAGADGKWGSECVGVSKKAVCKRRVVHKYPNLTKLVQRIVGVNTDGKFGGATKKAVITWQKAHRLDPDGSVGPATWKVMLGVAK